MGTPIAVPVTVQTPWWRNPIAIAGYLLQVVGAILLVASFLGTTSIPGMPPWVQPVCGLVLAVGTALGLQGHSAWVRGKELETAAGSNTEGLPAAGPPA